MKNKKGFTLVEVLAVLVILTVVLTLSTLTVRHLLAKNKQKALDSKQQVLLKHAVEYAKDNEETFIYASNNRYGNYVCNTLTVKDLIDNGYLDHDNILNNQKIVINPVTNESMNNDKIMVYIKSKENPNSINYETLGIFNGNYISIFDNDLCGLGGSTVISEFSDASVEQTYTVDKDGVYIIEAWGAQGGSDNIESGGYGAYSYVEVHLTAGQVLYINVGTQGNNNTGGYNGGGNGANSTNYKGFGGGGATHVALRTGLLNTLSSYKSDILVVAAGGGGASNNKVAAGGNGGGIQGNNGINTGSTTIDRYIGTGATQTTPGYTSYFPDQKGSFGKGSNYYPTYDSGNNNAALGGAGGGGGLYGGGGSCRTHAGAGGGSSYIGNPLVDNGVMYCYNCRTSKDAQTKTISTNKVSNQPVSKSAKMGNGYVKISYKNSIDDVAVAAVNVYYDNTNSHVNCSDVQCMLDYISRLIS